MSFNDNIDPGENNVAFCESEDIKHIDCEIHQNC